MFFRPVLEWNIMREFNNYIVPQRSILEWQFLCKLRPLWRHRSSYGVRFLWRHMGCRDFLLQNAGEFFLATKLFALGRGWRSCWLGRIVKKLVAIKRRSLLRNRRLSAILFLVDSRGIEPLTPSLQMRCSTPELRALAERHSFHAIIIQPWIQTKREIIFGFCLMC